MADYSKQTVAQLRQLLKDRSIASTGLTRKAQIIEKLEEADHQSGEAYSATTDGGEQVEDSADEHKATLEDAPTPRPFKAGEPEPEPALTHEIKPTPLPAAATNPQHGSISHVDSNIPPPGLLKTDEQPAVDIVPEEEVEDMQEVSTEQELPSAPRFAAEDSRLAQPTSELLEDQGEMVVDDNMSSPIAHEQSSVEKPELLTIPERSTAETSRLNTEELEADFRKRKRRSNTPDVPMEDIRAKKQRPSQEPAPEIHLREDEDVVTEQCVSGEKSDKASNWGKASPITGDLLVTQPDTKREMEGKAAHYRDLVGGRVEDTPSEAMLDDRPTIPALHPVTAALYIRNFMRPLRPEPLRAHLTSLASPPSASTDTPIVETLFLDAMKTHALVLFSTTTAASRVRASLHGSIWPPEGNRKELWVDFIPDDRVKDWIREEESAMVAERDARANGHSHLPKRFEVVYPEASDGSITAVFQEVGSSAPSNAPRGPRAGSDAHRSSAKQPLETSAPATDTRQGIEASFKTLDDLFSSTVAKPQLFYLPVSDETSEARLKEFDNETSRDWTPGETRKGRGIKTEMKFKYSFDEYKRVVEVGDDRGPWSETYGGVRGGLRGRGRGNGGQRGRGGDARRGSMQ